MTVKELIAELLEYEMDDRIVFRSGSMEAEIKTVSQKHYEKPYVYLEE